jgi:hypothetical protein
VLLCGECLSVRLTTPQGNCQDGQERIEASRLWNTLLIFHLPNHQPFVLGDLISENVFESIDTLSRDERDYLVFERETDISILIM